MTLLTGSTISTPSSTPPRIDWTTGTVTSNAERRAETQRKYKGSPRGRVAQRAATKSQTEKEYLSRPFIAWDGEGITLPSGEHLYTSLQSSSGVSLHDEQGLSTFEILDALIDESNRLKSNAIHVIYGGGYDFNMWLSNVPTDLVEKLYRTGRVSFGGYVLSWRPSKYFRVKRRKDGVSILVNDVVSFFQKAFVAACDEYLGDNFIERDLIVEMKKRRGTFTLADSALVDVYNNAELENLVLLMTELRKRLNAVGLRPSRWDGPGAIAVALMQREGVKDGMGKTPDRVAEASRYAYAGGRFEVFKHGLHTHVWEYDINSAYPTALQHVPNLKRGYWRKSARPVSVHDFGIYRVRFICNPDNYRLPQPLWTRSPKGSIFYGYNLENWYWAPEVIAAQAYVRKHGGSLEIVEGYKFHPNKNASKPFDFIPPMFAQRRALKKAGDGAHYGIKLGLNSLYGKTCQRVGARLQEDGTWRIPPYHQLEWAGYVTSYCRAHLLLAVLDRLDDVIAMETDAMFIQGKPLEGITLGSDLGEWESTEFDKLAYGQSGFYTGTLRDDDSTLVVRTRGVDRPSGDEEREAFASDLLESIRRGEVFNARLSRFVGVGLALQLNKWGRWRRWEQTPKNVTMEPTGKRIHDAQSCLNCQGSSTATDSAHTTIVPLPFWNRAESSPYPIPWINPNTEMTELDELSAMSLEMMGHDYE